MAARQAHFHAIKEGTKVVALVICNTPQQAIERYIVPITAEKITIEDAMKLISGGLQPLDGSTTGLLAAQGKGA